MGLNTREYHSPVFTNEENSSKNFPRHNLRPGAN